MVRLLVFISSFFLIFSSLLSQDVVDNYWEFRQHSPHRLEQDVHPPTVPSRPQPERNEGKQDDAHPHHRSSFV